MPIFLEKPIPPDITRFRLGNHSITVRISGEWRSTRAQVSIDNQPFTTLKPPKYGYFLNRNEWKNQLFGRPNVNGAFIKGRPVVWLHSNPIEGTHDEITVSFFEYFKGTWVRLHFPKSPGISLTNSNPWFTNRGAYFVRNSRLYIWDIADYPNVAYTADQRYNLTIFRLSSPPTILSSKRTKKNYFPEGDKPEFNFERVLPKDDPLREFGLKWRWWEPEK